MSSMGRFGNEEICKYESFLLAKCLFRETNSCNDIYPFLKPVVLKQACHNILVVGGGEGRPIELAVLLR
jgi:hypothetical protein